ncbi:MAG TPA: ATP-grasp domain-containing protein [Candidatus Andersenbacteria bacterium]|nr:ATP-grasp domain-containing protein [Candidatus Andersenbacteria bacterium]
MKPRVVVFYGGDAEHANTSRESGAWVCRYIPKSEYDVTPVAVTHDGLWKVPLGSLPKSGNTKHAMDMLAEAVPAQDPKQALQRLLNRTVDSIITVLRGRGGDDGAMHSFGELMHLPVKGSNASVSKLAHNKHHFTHAISDVAPTPYSQIIKKQTSEEDIRNILQSFFTIPFFIKPSHGAGSHGVIHVRSQEDLEQSIKNIQNSLDDVLIQEERHGDEIAITVYKEKTGALSSLPASIVTPRNSSFFNYDTKQTGHDNLFYHNHDPRSSIIHQAETIARDVYDSLGCDGIATVDMIADNGAIDVIELNTIPTFTSGTPIVHQLRHAGIHPEELLKYYLP